MKIINHIYRTGEALDAFLRQGVFAKPGAILIQVFAGIDDPGIVQSALDQIAETLPGAGVIGSSSAGEIVNGHMMQGRIVISCSIFEEAAVKTGYASSVSNEGGIAFASSMIDVNARAVICFTEGLNSDPEAFVSGISSINGSVVLAGGNASAKNRFDRPFVIEGRHIHATGAVAAVLSGTGLKVANAYSLDWLPIGREFVITRSDKNRVHEIDHVPIRELCRKYLGDESITDLPSSISAFPLIKTSEPIPVARSIVAVHADGSFQYAGNLNPGDRVRFSVSDIDAVIEGAVNLKNKVAEYPAEAVFIYSCRAKKLLLSSRLESEFRLLETIAPTSGFFTHGEFFHSGAGHASQILNISTTVLVLSEDDQAFSTNRGKKDLTASTIKTLVHLVNSTQLELEKNINFLNQYKKAVDESSIIAKTDMAGVITYVNDKCCEISNYSRGELIGRNYSDLQPEGAPGEMFNEIRKTVMNGNVWRGILKNRKKNGDVYFADSAIIPVFDYDGRINECIALLHDITMIIQQHQRIQQLATDPLTNLPNRIQLLEDVKAMQNDCSLILIDIDNFSVANDLYGIAIGDAIIIKAGSRLKRFLDQDLFKVYRLPNDVFAVLYPGRDCRLGEETAATLQRLINSRYEIDGAEIHLSCTASIACGTSFPYQHAEIALRKAKQKQIPFLKFDTALIETTTHEQNFLWLRRLREAFASDRIIPYFQPIVCNETGGVDKYESLVRLIRKDGTVASPSQFLSIAKKAKLYPRLTRRIVEQSLGILQRTSHEISINLSVEDILNKDTIAFLLHTMRAYNVSDRVVLEITEGEGFDNFDELLSLASQVKTLGGKVAIDDFGTGYSNFSYLLKIHPDFIKIDGSIIKNIDTDPSAQAIVETIVAFSQKLNIRTIAEFVSSEAILVKVKSLGIDYSQGYFLGEPKPGHVIFP